MQFHFSELNKAANYTLKFYGIDRIADYLLTDFNSENRITDIKQKNNWHETVFKLHDHMNEEIAQNAVFYNDIGKAYFFGLLKEWLGDYRIESTHIPTIANAIENYNTKEYEEFIIKTEEKENIFKEREDYKKYKHLEEIERKLPGGAILWGGSRGNHEITIPETFHRFICVYTPKMIDTALIPNYIALVNELLFNFRGIIKFHLEKYETVTGLIAPGTQLQLPPTKELAQISLPEPDKMKLKTTLSVEQLTMLFRLLKDCKIIEAKYDKEIHAFIADNFETVGKGKVKISAKNLGKLWSSTDNDILNFWIAKFKELTDKAKNK